MTQTRTARDETGAVAIMSAVVLVVLLALMAFVVDYGLVRADVRHSQSAGDAASLAGVAQLADVPGDYQGACQAAVDYLEANLGVTFVASICDNFASPDPFEAGGVTCASRAATDPLTVPPSEDTTESGPVYVEDTSGPYTVRIQMPVRDGDPQMNQQTVDPDDDGTDPCKRLAVSVRRARSTVFGAFAGNGGEVSGVADAVSLYDEGEESLDIPSLIVLDPTGCRTLEVTSNSGRLLVENLEDGAGDVEYPGLVTIDSDGTGCGNGASEYVIRPAGGNSKICAGVDPDRFAAIVGGADCDSLPDTLRTRSVNEDNPARGAFGRAVDENDTPPLGSHVEPPPISGRRISRMPADHQWNCRSGPPPAYPLSSDPGGELWHPHYEDDLDPCGLGRAANMDELLDDLASGNAFASVPGWQTINSCSPPAGTIGDGTTNLYFNCPILDVKSDVNIWADQYVVVSGRVEVGAGGLLSTNYTASGLPAQRFDSVLGADREQDIVMVIRGKSPGNPGVGLSVSSSAVGIDFNRTAVYLHEGATNIDAGSMKWSAPTYPGYDPVTGAPIGCVETQDFGASAYQLPSPECFEKLALWTNNHRVHTLNGGAILEAVGVFFTPYAGLDDDSSFNLSGGISQQMSKAQFFTYRFKMTGGSTLALRPDPNENLKVRTTSVGLIR